MVSVRWFQCTGGEQAIQSLLALIIYVLPVPIHRRGIYDTIITGTDNIRRRVNGEIANEAFGAI